MPKLNKDEARPIARLDCDLRRILLDNNFRLEGIAKQCNLEPHALYILKPDGPINSLIFGSILYLFRTAFPLTRDHFILMPLTPALREMTHQDRGTHHLLLNYEWFRNKADEFEGGIPGMAKAMGFSYQQIRAIYRPFSHVIGTRKLYNRDILGSLLAVIGEKPNRPFQLHYYNYPEEET